MRPCRRALTNRRAGKTDSRRGKTSGREAGRGENRRKAAPAPQSKTDAAAAKLNEYYEKAKAAGQMNIVHYGPGPEYAPMVEAFKQKFPGVTAETVNLRGVETTQRIAAEAASGKRIANVVSGGATSLVWHGPVRILRRVGGPPNASDLPPTVPASKVRYALIISMFGYIVNTSLVPGQDSTDPSGSVWTRSGRAKAKWYSRTRAGGPAWTSSPSPTRTCQEYLDKLKAQEPTFIRDRDAAPAQIARGEYNIFLPLG